MLPWLSANWLNLVLIAGIVLIAALAIHSMIRGRKAGRSPCGCDCASCGVCPRCSGCCEQTKE